MKRRFAKTSARKRRIGILHARKTKRGERALETIRTISNPFQVAKILTYLRKLDPFVFEELLLTVLDDAGYRIKRNKRYTGDGGADGWFQDTKGNTILLQAKRYSSYVKVKHLEEFSSLVALSGAMYGIFVHTGRTGPKSRWKRSSNITIVSGNHLVRLLLNPNDTFLRKDVGA